MTDMDTSTLAPKIIKGGDKNGELDREVELDAQDSTAKLLCEGLVMV